MRKTKGGAGVFFACKMDLGGNEKASFIYNGVRIVIPLGCAIVPLDATESGGPCSESGEIVRGLSEHGTTRQSITRVLGQKQHVNTCHA